MKVGLPLELVGQRLADLPEAMPELQLLVLFGSAARGRMKAESDVNLAVQCDGSADLDALYLAIAARLGTDRLDLIDLRRAGPLLAFEVGRACRLLFERSPGTFRQFQSSASRRYCDTEKLRRAQRRSIHAFLEARGPGMSPLDAAIIRRKLAHLVASLDSLRPLSRLNIEEYRARLYERKAAERLLQETIEATLDINAHLIAELGGEVPDEYYSGFLKMAELGILPSELARSLAPSAGLRNRLVHEYETIATT